MCSLVSAWKTTVASIRLRNSGRKTFFIALRTLSFILSYCAASGLRLLRLDGEAEGGLLADEVGADVGGHDDDGVAEVDLAALGVGQVAVVEDLQQHVEDVRVRLLDLVEEDEAVGLAADGVGELAAVVVADVAGRGADEPRDVVLLHELGHVELDHGLFGCRT